MIINKSNLSQEEFRQLCDFLPHLSWYIDLKTGLKLFNKSWIDYFGSNLDYSNWPELIHPEDLKECLPVLKDSESFDESWEATYRLKRRDGKYRWHLGKSICFKDEKGVVVSRMGTATDIDNLKRIEEDQRFMASSSEILGNSFDIEITLSKIFDLTLPRFNGSCRIHLKEDGKVKNFSNSSKAFSSTNKYSDEFFHSIEKKGARLINNENSLICCPLKDEKETFGFITFESKYKFDEQDFYLAKELARRISLNIINAHLLNQHVTARKEVEKLVKKLQRAVDSRDIFLGICSHELKTPVTSLKLLSQITMRQLERDQFVIDKKNVFANILKFSKQIDRLTHLIETMLDVSRIDSGKLIFRKDMVNLYDLAHEIREKFSVHFKELNIPFSADFEPGIEAMIDQTRIEQVLVNILNNAIKYGGKMPVHFSLTRENDKAIFKVIDQGQGISQNHLRSIFKRFERVSVDPNVTGLGLGLFISKTIVDAHRGDIVVESDPGKGSTFSILLPLDT